MALKTTKHLIYLILSIQLQGFDPLFVVPFNF